MALFDNKEKNKEKADPAVSGMNKQQLLELLIEQTKEVENLQKENEELRERLAESKQIAREYRADLDHAFSLLRLTMRLENAVAKLDPSYEPESYEDSIYERLAEEEAKAEGGADTTDSPEVEAETDSQPVIEEKEEDKVEETAPEEN